MTKWSYLSHFLSYGKVIDHFGILGILTLLFWISKEKRPLKAPEVDASKIGDGQKKHDSQNTPSWIFDFLVKMGGIHPLGCYIKKLQTPFSVFLRKNALKLKNWFLLFFQASALKCPILNHFSINIPLEYYPGTSFRQRKPILAFKDLKNSKKCLN